MKPINQEKMIKYISTLGNVYSDVEDLNLSKPDMDEIITRLGRKLSFLKAIRGPIEPERPKSVVMVPKWRGDVI